MTTSRQVINPPNPTGKGGFQERPQDRNPGHWKPQDSISFQYNKLIRMSPEDLKQFQPETVAQKIALKRIEASFDSLKDTQEITDRIEGKAPQSLDLTTNGKEINNSELSDEELNARIRRYIEARAS